jgi:hypothetical protein
LSRVITLDSSWCSSDSSLQSLEEATVDKPTDIPPQEMAGMEEVMRLVSEGKRVTDPELLGRIRERSEKVQRETREK